MKIKKYLKIASKLIKLETGFDIEKRILKYNGLSFTVEELTRELRNILDQG